MQRAISTRIDESVYQIIERIVLEKKLTKKKIIEEAVKNFCEKIYSDKEVDPFAGSFGAWKRDESTKDTIKNARAAFNHSMARF